MNRAQVRQAAALLAQKDSIEEVREKIRDGAALFTCAMTGDSSMWGEVKITNVAFALSLLDQMERSIQEQIKALGVTLSSGE